MFNWQEWRKEIREDRKESPVETFGLLFLLVLGVVFMLFAAAVFLYYFPIPIISMIVVTVVLWKLYQRI